LKAVRALFNEFRSGQGLKGQLLRGGFWSLVIKLLSTAMALVLAVVLARLLGPEGFGIYSFAFACITIMAIPAQMGLPNLLVRETAKAQVNARWDIMKGLWRWSSLVALAMSLALTAIGSLVIWLFSNRLGPEQVATFWWGLLLIPLVTLGNLRGAALRGLRKVVQGQLPEFVLRPLFFIVLALAAWGLFGTALGPADAMMLHVVAAFSAFAIGAWLLFREQPPELMAQRQSSTEGRAWLASAVPLSLVTGLQTINTHVGIVVMGMLGLTEGVAHYRIAMQGSLLVSFGLYAANQAASPYFARLHSKENLNELQTVATQTALVALAVALPVWLTLIVLGEPVVTLVFGTEFSPAVLPLALLATGQLASALAASVTTLLAMTGYANVTVRVSLVTIGLNLCLTLVLVPYFSATGAAFAMMVGVAFHTMALRIFVRRKLCIEPSALALLNRRHRGEAGK